MGFFSKNRKDDIGFIINSDDDNIKISGDKNMAPHAITPEEVSELWVLNDESEQTVEKTSALDSLKKRMSDSVQKNHEKAVGADLNRQPPKEEAEPEPAQLNQADDVEKQTESSDKSLLEKLHRYTVDEQGRDLSKSNEPLYHLESVAEIIKHKTEDSIKNLSEKYDVFFDDLSKGKNSSETKAAQDNAETSAPTSIFEQMVTDSEKREEEQLHQSISGGDNNGSTSEPDDIDIPDISDIDNREYGINREKPIAETATVRFTPIKDSKGNTDHITISSITQHIDLEGSVQNAPDDYDTALEQSEFERFEPKSEIEDIASGKKMLRRLALKKRSAFLCVLGSLASVIALSVFLLPPVFDFIITNPKAAMFVCGGFLLFSTLCNCGMFADFSRLFNKKCTADILASAASVFTLSLSICAALTNSNAYYIILLCAVILFIRSISRFKSVSATQGNLKLILNEKEKNAVTLISDSATTFAMAKNSIEGDVLAVAHKKSAFIQNFIKYSTFRTAFSSRLPLIFCISTALALISGAVAYFYYRSIFDAFYCTASIAVVSALPTLFFIDSLPLSSAAKKLNAKGAVILGMHGAEEIESANAAVVSVKDIFPEGTVKMYSMKVLSDNDIDRTILKAASLTAAVNSPLEAIFNQIAGTNTSYSIPDSDTVKYEKRLGISGWVDNELLFIGNRSLMEAHGIAIPSIEVDKKILRKGYFPVYVATENTACALIVIQYDVNREIAKQLRKITDMGITLLVENSDPNINEEMLCDYFGLYEDSVKIMTNAGVYMYKNATPFAEKCSAPAAFRGSGLNFIRIINCASGIKKSNALLTVMYVLFAVLGIMYFVYASFSGLEALPQALTVLIYVLAVTVLSIIGFLIRKP